MSAMVKSATATVAQVQRKARAWLDAEIERSRTALGPTWALHAAWVLAYLRAEMAERMARWRA